MTYNIYDDLNLSNHKIGGVANPTESNEATTKDYVDTALAEQVAETEIQINNAIQQQKDLCKNQKLYTLLNKLTREVNVNG